MAENAESKSLSHMSRLERSLVSAEVRRFQNETTQPLAVFLQDMGIELRKVVDAKGFGQVGDRQVPNLHFFFDDQNAENKPRKYCLLLERSCLISKTYST